MTMGNRRKFGELPTLFEFFEIGSGSMVLSDIQKLKIEQVIKHIKEQTSMSIDEEKLIKSLQERANKSKDLAKQYKDAGEKDMAMAFEAKSTVCTEIIYDIRKGKFKLK